MPWAIATARAACSSKFFRYYHSSCNVASSASHAAVPPMPDSFNPLGPPGFVFDIDGVLIRGKHVIAAAKEAMTKVGAKLMDMLD